MNNRLPPKFITISIATLSVFCFAGLFFAQEVKAAPASKENADGLPELARKYREEGFKLQSLGNLPAAMSFYQKAIAVDPGYAMVYNDLGVIYEAMGSFDLAEENYLKSIKIDPLYSSVYTNLALFYEGQRNFKKAAFYWNKRVEVGTPDDPWTQKAINRLRDIRMSLSDRPFSDQREEEVLGLMKDISENKTEFNKDDKSLAQMHFNKAKHNFEGGDMSTAFKEALDAQYLDQNNPEIEAFIEKAERRALTR
ncbi:MAG: tetratricopeptide repeat protein [Candidatus Omnitrophica bacterium]|nr:tetratricopeptide repeat protein [Candidatus Omnitrophota bacterium]